VSEPSLYLFDGSNLFHAGRFSDRDDLVDLLASFVALRGARGVVVFDGVGEDRALGSLGVRFAPDADVVLERLAAESAERDLSARSDPGRTPVLIRMEFTQRVVTLARSC
jgi:hypothetical protein